MPRTALVVGAGLAGLVAADELARDGFEVEVLEARERVGGRTWSRRLANGATIEMGAEFILPGNTEIAALARDLGLGLWDKGMRYGNREPHGGIGVDEAELAAGVAAVDGALASLESGAPIAARLGSASQTGASTAARLGSASHDRPTARELLDSLELAPGAREAILARLEISSGSSAGEVPASDMAGLAHIGDDPAPSVAGGNQGVALALAVRLGDRVRLADPVVSIEWGDDGARAATADGHVAEADAAVIAVPPSVLGAIELKPVLPDATLGALRAVRYGHAAKLFVPLAGPVAPSAVMNVAERWWCWTATGEGDEPTPVVSCFAGSPAALQRLELGAGPGRWIESLRALRPDLELVEADAVLSTWDDDPWVRAAYSVSPGAELSAALAEPVGSLAFAGEHTAGPFAALMEGAVRSGRRAAADIAHVPAAP